MTTTRATHSRASDEPHSPDAMFDSEKPDEKRLEMIDTEGLRALPTNERVPGHKGYYEKNGLRTSGDGVDHSITPTLTMKRFLAIVAMCFLWTGSQIPVYLFGGVPPYIYGDIGGADRWIWFVLANLLSLAAICPFVGSISDIIGRRYIAMIGASLIILGMIVCSTAHTMNIFISGMVFAGVGAGINELTALAATAEIAPTSQRGKYVAVLVFTIIPFCPSVLWAQLIASQSKGAWRYIGLFCALWAFIGLVMTVLFYHPPPRVNSTGMTRKAIARQIDYVGGILSVSGMLLFMMGLEWAGYQYTWGSAHVLAPLILGIVLIIAFIVWEAKFAPYPMWPKRLNHAPRIFALTLLITFISGANFFSVIMFWPTQAYNVYGHNPVQVGLRGLPVGFSILTGAVIVLVLLSVLRGHNRALLIASSILMTAGTGAIAVARVDNMSTVYGLLVLAGLGIGGIVVPASIITTIICPDDLIATVSALTLAVRVVGGAVGYCTYYNIFINKFKPLLVHYVGGVMAVKLGIEDKTVIAEALQLTGASMLDQLKLLPGLQNPLAYEAVVAAGQLAFAEAYKWVYYASIAFGFVSIVAACFLGDISQYMDDHVAVVIG